MTQPLPAKASIEIIFDLILQFLNILDAFIRIFGGDSQ